MGPLCGIFDQRAAETLNHHAGHTRLRRDLGWRGARVDDGRPRHGDALEGRPRRHGPARGVTGTRRVRSRGRLGAQRRPRRGAARLDRREAGRHRPVGRRAQVGKAHLARAGRPAPRPFRLQCPSAGRAGWFPTSTGPPGCSRPWPSWASTTCTTAGVSRPPGAGAGVRREVPQGAGDGQRGGLPVPPGLGGGAAARDLREHPRGEGAVRRGQRRSPRAGSIRATPRCTGNRSATSTSCCTFLRAPARRGAEHGPELAGRGSGGSRRTGRRPAWTGGSRCARASTRACASSTGSEQRPSSPGPTERASGLPSLRPGPGRSFTHASPATRDWRGRATPCPTRGCAGISPRREAPSSRDGRPRTPAPCSGPSG